MIGAMTSAHCTLCTEHSVGVLAAGCANAVKEGHAELARQIQAGIALSQAEEAFRFIAPQLVVVTNAHQRLSTTELQECAGSCAV